MSGTKRIIPLMSTEERRKNTEFFKKIDDAKSKEELEQVLDTSGQGIDINQYNDSNVTILSAIKVAENNLWKPMVLLGRGANPLLGKRLAVPYYLTAYNTKFTKTLSLLCEYGGGLVLRMPHDRQGLTLLIAMLLNSAVYRTQEESLAFLRNAFPIKPVNAALQTTFVQAYRQKGSITSEELRKQYTESELLLAARKRSGHKEEVTWVFTGRVFSGLLKDHIDSVETNNDVWLPHADRIMTNLLAASECPISRPHLAPAALDAVAEVGEYVSERFRAVTELLSSIKPISQHAFTNNVIGICHSYMANRAIANVPRTIGDNGVVTWGPAAATTIASTVAGTAVAGVANTAAAVTKSTTSATPI